jgi:hypothetical protein
VHTTRASLCMLTVEQVPSKCFTWCGCHLIVLLKKALLDDHKVRCLQYCSSPVHAVLL